MARGNQVILSFAGDATSLTKTFDDVGVEAKDMAGDIDRASRDMVDSAGDTRRGFDSLGEGIDGSERKFTGFGDTIEGTGDIMEGFRSGNLVQVARGFADLAGGITDFAVPAIKSLGSTIGGVAKSLVTPPFGIIAVVGGLAVALVAAWQNSEEFRDIVTGAFEAVQSVVGPIISGIGSVLGNIFGSGGSTEEAEEAVQSLAATIDEELVAVANSFDGLQVAGQQSLEELTTNIKETVDSVPRFFEGARVLFERGFDELAQLALEQGPQAASRWVSEAALATDAELQALNNNVIRQRGLEGGETWVHAILEGSETALNAAGTGLTHLLGRLSRIDPTGLIGLGAFQGANEMHSGGIVPGPSGANVPIIAQAGEMIVPRTSVAAGAGGGVVVNVTVQGTVTAARDLATEVRDQLAGLERRGARLGFT